MLDPELAVRQPNGSKHVLAEHGEPGHNGISVPQHVEVAPTVVAPVQMLG